MPPRLALGFFIQESGRRLSALRLTRREGRETQREKSEHNRPAPGDIRLLFSIYRGNPVAVLYDYRRPGLSDSVEFTSVKTTRIDRVRVIEDATIAIRRGRAHYVLRAAVPLAALDGWTPKPGTTYPGDFGVVYSDAAGATNMLRMHWSNTATAIVNDLSFEADIQPDRWGALLSRPEQAKRHDGETENPRKLTFQPYPRSPTAGLLHRDASIEDLQTPLGNSDHPMEALLIFIPALRTAALTPHPPEARPAPALRRPDRARRRCSPKKTVPSPLRGQQRPFGQRLADPLERAARRH